MTTPNRRLFIVAYPVLGEVGGVLLDEDGTRLAVQQAATGDELVQRLAADIVDTFADLVVVPGWDKAPEGLREKYEAWKVADGQVIKLSLDADAEEKLAAARKILGIG